MAFFQYLVFDGENLPLPDSYEVELEDVEADSGGETEAGTTQRDVVRHGVVSIPVSFSVTAKDVYKRQHLTSTAITHEIDFLGVQKIKEGGDSSGRKKAKAYSG